MSLDNLGSKDKERIKSGDIQLIKEIIKKELEDIKEDLIFLPMEKVEELRGKARILVSLIKLL